MCPTMQEDHIEQVHAVDGGFNRQITSTRQSRPIVPSPWISSPTELSSKTTPCIHKL